MELIGTFLADSVVRLQALELGWANGNLTLVRAQAHSLKGSCAQMGVDSMVQCCQAMETLAVEEKQAEGRALVARLAVELAAVRAVMERYGPSGVGAPRETSCAS